MQITTLRLTITTAATITVTALISLYIGYLLFRSSTDDATALKSYETKVTQLETELATTQSELVTAKTELVTTKTELAKTQSELANKGGSIDTTELESYKTQVTQLKTELAKTQSELESKKDLIDPIKHKEVLDERNKIIYDLTMEKEMLKIEIVNLKDQQANPQSSNTDIDQLKAMISQLTGELNKAKEQSEIHRLQLNQELAIKNDAIKRQKAEISNLQSKNQDTAELNEKITKLEDELNVKTSQLQAVKDEQAHLAQEFEIQSETVKSRDDELQRLKLTVERLEKESASRENTSTKVPHPQPIPQSSHPETESLSIIPEPTFFAFNGNENLEKFRSAYFSMVRDKVKEALNNSKLNKKEIRQDDITDIIILSAYSKSTRTQVQYIPMDGVNHHIAYCLRTSLQEMIYIYIKDIQFTTYVPFKSIGLFFPELERLELINCGLTDEILKKNDFNEGIGKNTVLYDLDLSDNNLETLPNLSEFHKLMYLKLNNNNRMAIKDATTLMECLPNAFKASKSSQLQIKQSGTPKEQIEDLKKLKTNFYVHYDD